MKTFEELWDNIEIDSRRGPMQHLSYWSNALAGEVGEFANQIKKYDNPDKDVDWEALCEEYADVFIYWVCLAKVLGWGSFNVKQIIEKKLEKLNNIMR